MPKPARYAVIWSQTNHTYDLLINGAFQQSLGGEEKELWLHWLDTHTHFSFQGQGGHLNVLKEERSRGEGYWYAYTYRNQRKVKRYLGKAGTITLARLEEMATTLTSTGARSAQTVEIPRTQRTMISALPAPSPSSMSPETAHWPGFPLLPKLSPPRQPATLVARARLLEQLDQVLTHQLTLLSASAGFGKTTLLSCWAAHRAHLMAWLSLEEQDNEPLRFWSYVVAALRTQEPGIGETALGMLQSPRPPALTTILATLINDLATAQRDMVLALDDFHVINNPAIIHSMQFLLEHLPSRLHLALAGRADPPLALPRLRARRQLIELRDQDLRFTRAEAAQFLTRVMGFPLLEADIDVLEQRVEGWVAGLQLVALAMRTRVDYSTFIRQLSGSQRFILDYMQDEVLERQPQEVQNFLLQTAILTRLHASLCQAVTAETSAQTSQQMLLTLEKANLFLIPLDEERSWYRLHSLFRDVLQARLQATSPELVPLLHQRAARWYARQEDIFEAVEHALAGADYAFAADLMERSAAHMWADGQSETLANWLGKLPDAFLLAHARLVLTGLLYLLNHAFSARDEQWKAAVRQAEQTIARIEPLLEKTAADAPRLRKRIVLLRGWIANKNILEQTDSNQARHHTLQMQELVSEEDSVWKMIPFFNLVARERNWVALLPALFALKRQAEQEQQEYEVVQVMSWIGQAYQQAGKLRQAEQIDKEGLQRLQGMGKARAMFGYFHCQLAWLHWEWNRPDEALPHLMTAIRCAQNWQLTDIQVTGSYLFFQMLLAEGKDAEAAQILNEAEQSIQRSSQETNDWIVAMRGQLWLAQGNLTAAADWAAHLPPVDLSSQRSEYFTTLLRLYLALRKKTEAFHLLAELLSQAERLQRTWDTILFLALQVVAHYHAGEMSQARQVAARLLALTEAERAIRVYLDAGQPMRQVLQSILDSPLALENEASAAPFLYVNSLLQAFEQGPIASSNKAPTAPASSLSQARPAPSLFPPLTTREQEVFHLLAQGWTNQEIADRLVISFATAKKHVANILSKLGAENRVQAIARAHEYGLL